MRLTSLSIFTAAFTLIASTAQAQTPETCSTATKAAMSCATTSSLSIDVPHLASVSAGTVTTPTITVSDLNAGYREFDGPSVTVKANYQYTVTATASALNSKLSIKNVEAASFGALSSGVAIAADAAATASSTINTKLKVNLGWTTDAPGTLSSTLTFTVTMP